MGTDRRLGQRRGAGDSGVLRNALAAPVDGERVAFQEGSGEWITQVTEHRLVAGATYPLGLWARSINRIGNTAETVVEAGLAAGGTELAVRQVAVNPARLRGAPLHEPNDGGGNVWIDGDRRHQFADIHLYQELDADPLRDPWHASWSDYAAYDRFGAWAVAPDPVSRRQVGVRRPLRRACARRLLGDPLHEGRGNGRPRVPLELAAHHGAVPCRRRGSVGDRSARDLRRDHRAAVAGVGWGNPVG